MRLFLYRDCASHVTSAFESVLPSSSEEFPFQGSLVTWIPQGFNRWEALARDRQAAGEKKVLGTSPGPAPSPALLHAAHTAVAVSPLPPQMPPRP